MKPKKPKKNVQKSDVQMNKTEHIKKAAVLEALRKSLGVVTDACEQAKIGRTTFYGWLKNDPEFADEVKNIDDVAKDFIESKMYELMNGVKVKGKKGVYKIPPNPTAVIHGAKTKCRDRGWGERTELTGPNGQPLYPNDKMTPEQVKECAKEVLATHKVPLVKPRAPKGAGNE